MPLVTAGLNRNSIHAEEYPMNHRLNKDRIETLHAARFLNLYDLQYAEGKHYFEASRRGKNDLVVRMTDEEVRGLIARMSIFSEAGFQALMHLLREEESRSAAPV